MIRSLSESLRSMDSLRVGVIVLQSGSLLARKSISCHLSFPVIVESIVYHAAAVSAFLILARAASESEPAKRSIFSVSSMILIALLTNSD